MNLSRRELTLFGTTLCAGLLGGTYFIVAPQVENWRLHQESQVTLKDTLQSKMDLVASSEELRDRAQQLDGMLPAHGSEDDVLGKLYPLLERKVRNHGVQLNSRQAGAPVRYGEMYELPINCRWEADIEDLLQFLEDLQGVEASLDVTSISIQPISKKNKERLKGTFTIRYVYKLKEELN